MTNINLVAKKRLKRKKHSQVVNIFKKSVRSTIITKCILDLRVNLTIGELLASVSAVEKQFIKAIFEDEVI